jgi:hypothetical protein
LRCIQTRANYGTERADERLCAQFFGKAGQRKLFPALFVISNQLLEP